MRTAAILLIVAALVLPAILATAQEPAAPAPAPAAAGGECRDCHAKPEVGDQWGKWKQSAHARAYEALAGEAAAAAAKRAGVEGDPKAAEACLACHAPLADKRETGVSCEVCHGPGAEWAGVCGTDFAAAIRKGMRLSSEADCLRCHRESAAHPDVDFHFTLDWGDIEHRRPVTDPEAHLFSTEGIYREWEVFTVKDGLPSNMVFGITPYRDEVWFATDGGVARLKDGKITAWTKKDGLPHDAATQVAVHEPSGEVWVSTLGGVACFDGKKWTAFTQESTGPKGLINNCGFGIAVYGDSVWVATFDGIGRYIRGAKEWKQYYLDNAPLDEVWCYGLEANFHTVNFAVWGGGLVQFFPHDETWEAHHDPDGSFEMDLIQDDGVISQMTTATSYDNGRAWVSSYFGACVFDGRSWQEWDMDSSGLRTNFNQFVKARRNQGWFCSNDGLLCFDLDRNRWVDYRRLEGPGHYGEITIKSRDGKQVRSAVSKTAIPFNFVWCAAFQGEDIWVGTSDGVARGRY